MKKNKNVEAKEDLKREKEIIKEQDSKDKKQEEKNQEPGSDINFLSFILSLHTSSLFHFGDMADPVSGKTEKNLQAAKQTIEILGMLKGKTEGNLDKNERKLLEGILYELRMKYIKETKA